MAAAERVRGIHLGSWRWGLCDVCVLLLRGAEWLAVLSRLHGATGAVKEAADAEAAGRERAAAEKRLRELDDKVGGGWAAGDISLDEWVSRAPRLGKAWRRVVAVRCSAPRGLRRLRGVAAGGPQVKPSVAAVEARAPRVAAQAKEVLEKARGLQVGAAREEGAGAG
jgi:hypothetical protein